MSASTTSEDQVSAVRPNTPINTSHDEPQQFLTATEIAAMMRVSRATVYRLVHAGDLPGIRVGKSLRIPRDAVRTYLRDAALTDPRPESLR